MKHEVRQSVIPVKSLWFVFSLFFMSIPLISSFGMSQSRPRPVMSGNTIVTGDTLQPLRGVRWALDSYGPDAPVPTVAELMEMRQNGCNTLHVYAEKYQFQGEPENGCVNPGCEEVRLQQLVDNTRQAGVYLVITVGDGNPFPEPCVPDTRCDPLTAPQKRDAFVAFNLAFWDRYAEKFKDETHVIYEIQNEPFFGIQVEHPFLRGYAQPTKDWVVEMNAKAYQTIQNKAPQTPVLLFSYAFLHDAPSVRTDLDRFEEAFLALHDPPQVGLGISNQGPPEEPPPEVNWDLVGVAFHGYFLEPFHNMEPLDALAELVSGPPIALVETEAWSLQTYTMNFDNILHYEHHGISWLSFNEPYFPNHHDWDPWFKDLLTQAPDGEGGLIWVPDDGTWPAVSNPPIGATISLNFHLGGFVRVDPASSQLIANGTEVDAASQFIVSQGPGNSILLRSEANGKYVTLASPCDDPYCETPILEATAAGTDSAQAFYWMTREEDSRVALQAVDTNNFVTADLNFDDPPLLRANRWRGGGSWSGFELVVSAPPPGPVPNFIGRIDGENVDGLTIETTEPLVDFSWNHAQSQIGIDRYQVVLKEVGAPTWLYDDSVEGHLRSHSLQTTGLANGASYSIHIRAWDDQGQPGPFVSGGAFIVELVPTEQEPFLGQPFAVAPDRFTVIHGEDFDLGGEDVAFYDTTVGNEAGHYRNGPGQNVDIVLTDHRYHLGFTDPGEWTEYALQIAQGTYDIEVWTATTFPGRRFFIALYDEFNLLLASTETEASVTPNTGDWGHFQKVVIPNVNLNGNLTGARFLRLEHLDGLINVDRIVFRPYVTRLAGDAFAGHNAGSGLNGTTSEFGAKVWQSHSGAVFAAPGWITNGGTVPPYGFLPFHPNEAGGKAVVIEADLNIDSVGQHDWMSLGFHTQPGSIWGGNGEIWLLIRRDGRYTVFVQSTTDTLANGQLSLNPREKAAPKRAVLKYDPATRQVSAWINGINVLDGVSLPTGFTPVINYAGFTTHSANLRPQEIFVDNFEINLQ